MSFTFLFVISCPPIIRMVNTCITNCDRRVSYSGNTCSTCNKASGTENCNIINRQSPILCINECGSKVSCKGNMCLPCAKAQGLSSGDITGQKKIISTQKSDAIKAAAAEYESLHSNVDNSSKAQAKAVAVATTSLTVKLAAIQTKNPGRHVSTSIFVASEGGGHLVVHEGRKSTLYQLSSGLRTGSIVKLENHDGVTYWNCLDKNERKTIGPDAVDIYDATSSKVIANHVEWQVQLHVRDVLPDNVMLLQVKPGAGGCQGKPPYKVGARFIVHDEHGNLPLGAILKSEIPSGTTHISEKPASRKRSLMDYFKSG